MAGMAGFGVNDTATDLDLINLPEVNVRSWRIWHLAEGDGLTHHRSKVPQPAPVQGTQIASSGSSAWPNARRCADGRLATHAAMNASKRS